MIIPLLQYYLAANFTNVPGWLSARYYIQINLRIFGWHHLLQNTLLQSKPIQRKLFNHSRNTNAVENITHRILNFSRRDPLDNLKKYLCPSLIWEDHFWGSTFVKLSISYFWFLSQHEDLYFIFFRSASLKRLILTDFRATITK